MGSYGQALKGAFQSIGTADFRRAIARAARLDSWIHTVTGLGGSRDRTTSAAIAAVVPLSPIELDHLYAGSDLAARVVNRLVDDSMRQRFGIDGAPPELAEALDRMGLYAKISDAAKWGRLFGGGALILGLSDRAGTMNQPLDLERVGEGDLLYTHVVDRQSLSINSYYDDPLTGKFGQPETFRISRAGRLTESVVHETRLILFGGALTSQAMRDRNGGWDLSVLQAVHEVLRDVSMSWRSVVNLLQDLSQAVFAIKGLVSMIAEGQKDAVMQRMEITDMARSVARAVVIDADSESFQHVGAMNVTGIEPIMMMAFYRLAAAAGMPLTLLMGMSPGGMNATGESDLRLWYDACQSYRDDELAPRLRVLAEIVARSEGIAVDSIEITWPSLWQPTVEQQIAIDKGEADTYRQWIDAGVLEPEEVTLAVFRDREAFADVIDFGAREESLNASDPEPPPIPPEPPGGSPAPGEPPPPTPPEPPGPDEPAI